MRNNLWIAPYKNGSASAKALAERLGARRILTEGSRFSGRAGRTVINWGRSELPLSVMALSPFNHPSCVKDARDKVRAFNLLTNARCPTVEWTTDPAKAVLWFEDGHTVFERHTTTGQGGAGIVVCTRSSTAPSSGAPLYTKQFRAKHEYRVHLVAGRRHVQKKRRREGAQPNAVRNHANGYVYCTQNVTPHSNVLDVAECAIKALGLHFGAVDILCTEGGEARVLEVNTAPGLEGSTLNFYVEQFENMVEYS